MSTYKIGLIDDHKIVRLGIRNLIEKLGNYEVTHEFEDGVSFLNALPLSNPPDIYILDYSMPSLNGIEVLQELEKREEEYLVLLLTQNIDEKIIDEAYQYGARGFLHKTCSANELKQALENIINTGYLSVSEILKRLKSKDDTKHNITVEKALSLSEKELKFLELVCDESEFTYDQMANMMGVSIKTVDFYRNNLFQKFQIKSKVGLVLISHKFKLTAPFKQ